MKFGALLVPLKNWKTVPEYLRLAEGYGFEYGWIADSHLLWNDVYQYLALCTRDTRRLLLGTLVTNPVTRHPTVVASSIATLNSLSGGRAVLGIGKGDSAVRTLGLRPARLKPFENAVRLIRDLSRGREVDVEGTAVQLPWVPRSDRGIPIYVAAYGPKTLEFAGQVADGVIIQIGSPSVIKWSLQHVQAGAKKAGRSMRDIDVVAATPCYVSNDKQQARDQLRYFPAVVSNHVSDMLSQYDRSELPTDLLADIDLITDYNYRHHGVKGAEHTATVSDALVDRLTVLGSADECIAKLHELKNVGVTQFCLYLNCEEMGVPESLIRSTMDVFGKQIIPAMH